MKTADLITVLDLSRIELESAYKKLGYSDSNVLKSVNESIVNLQSSQFKPEGKTLSYENVMKLLYNHAIPIGDCRKLAEQICSLTPNSKGGEAVEFDTEYKLQLFRETEREYFDDEGKPYRNQFSSEEATRMRDLINVLEVKLKKFTK